MQPLFHGILLGFGLILPLGVQNIFIFNQGANQRKLSHALPAVVTAAICDTLLICLAITGVSVVIFSFEWLKTSLFLVGFFFLSYMGWVMWKAAPETGSTHQRSPLSIRRQIAFAASVSLLNPHAILDTIGVIGTSSLLYVDQEKWMFAAAVIAVSWIWFMALAIVGRKLGEFDHNGVLFKRINQVSALIIWFMAIYILSQIF
ncbi:LysE/ArgO family amino acid transporter [Exiguobacterium sp. s142]|uniref:LysE/ArgO family amino acid transporter n=1 Tax=Exiguobacterium sp. s142 TaxID=2751222 RepID=UPI001BE7BF88|nr:LysE/ArgO family amino acid transporter [Exiguobacterium sp. s142]